MDNDLTREDAAQFCGCGRGRKPKPVEKESGDTNRSTVLSQIRRQTGIMDNEELPPRWQQKLYLKTHMFRRTLGPFLWLNIPMYLACFGLFVYFTVNIVNDYVDEQENPRTVVSTINEPFQDFPGMLICNNSPNADLTLIAAFFLPQAILADTGLNVDLSEFSLASQMVPVQINCPGAEEQTTYCYRLTDSIPAYGYQSGDSVCQGENELLFYFDINPDFYDSSTSALGVSAVLANSSVIEVLNFCELNVCTTTGAALEDPCNGANEINDPAFDILYATVNAETLVTLEKSVTEDLLSCGRSFIRWNPVTIVSVPNPKFTALVLGDETVARRLIQLRVRFRSPFIQTTRFESQSFASMIGSMAGWFGFLSDGWGVISLLFMLEKLYVHLTKHKWRRWTDRMIPKGLDSSTALEAEYINYSAPPSNAVPISSGYQSHNTSLDEIDDA
uniref:Uncharacterized protein n=1 Tax=Rhodosorus marinus TaxID=101924 RepID=A0A7S2ZX45_9RHOD|mmetsp:Transcript_36214/g.144847  ORF Transcript_36214/g.144847 Transcript_36214/m.144847 type:complete len:446 (+) Transcript_36214:343-1680(+)|eukprot:CAMPEP_0113966686 /NCGR_PEP_ID=MMETSP0011_2-20120614/8460_1 /TAXON_ID=101924 /ORGANISM="Rhodosorus marinus" /LENGTH=445 /DNA_ID=CAMNT_0000979381 /DNA_START=316 /DNA_END=1653 /DNA_ORIENTATION=+ /assembly_acc=CAM_ASM_000156